MAFVVDPGTIVPGTPGSPGVPGSYCPQGWTEDFDRAQMSTQVLINHVAPSDIPTFRYDFPGSFADPPPAGQITLNAPQTDATVMRVAKSDAGGADQSVWLRYVHQNCTVTITAVGRGTADDNNKSRGYRIVGAPTESASHLSWPVFWTAGTEAIVPGPVDLTLSITPEVPQLWLDSFGVDHYGRMTFNRTDLIRVDPLTVNGAPNPIYRTLADRILEIRGSNSVPRLESVTLDARTDHTFPMHNMNLMSSAAPEKPSRYLCRLQVEGRVIFERMMFTTAIRHAIARDEWTLVITMDLADWAAQL